MEVINNTPINGNQMKNLTTTKGALFKRKAQLSIMWRLLSNLMRLLINLLFYKKSPYTLFFIILLNEKKMSFS